MMLLVSPTFISSGAHRQHLCSSTPEKSQSFASEWFAFENAAPNHVTALNQQKENTTILHPGVNPTAVFSEVFMTCSNSSGINYSQNPQHFITESILLLSSLSLLLKPSTSRPYIDPYSPLSCDTACSEFLSLLAI